ncbi:kelch domain-containing protein 3 [Canna indica]|uniref:Kelch domain-containing protein 3 n=1 Tax=Canna indica TaxID=4628 RepID=A0AAQ3JM96_9LILI|nr:kelch domain-containing protein 3 [Canna indica]
MWWEVVRANTGAAEASAGEAEAAAEGTSSAGGICGPGVRWGHTCNIVHGGRYLYIFGGYGRDNCQTNDVHVFDTVKKLWTKPMLKGTPPSPRDSHSCTTVGDRLFVFGGTDGKNPLKDMHILDTSSNTWIMPDLYGEGPDAREGHSAVLIDKRLFIFGGCGKSETHEEKYYNDLYILDTEKLTWELAVTYGCPPSARDCHSCSTWNNRLIVIGGEDSSDFYLADIHILNADTLIWEPMKTSGKLFPPRAGHTTLALGSNLYVFGGFRDARDLYDDLHVLNVEHCTWHEVLPENCGPTARFSVAGDCLDERKGILVFLGGCDKSLEPLDDMYYLHTDIPVAKGLYDQRGGDLSIRRELRKKCRKEDLRETDQTGTIISDLKASGKVAFEARITNANHYGYGIETTINGKLLRGMIFSCTSNTNLEDHVQHRRFSTDTPAARRKSADQGQPTNNPCAKESTVRSPLVETIGSNLTNEMPCVMSIITSCFNIMNSQL